MKVINNIYYKHISYSNLYKMYNIVRCTCKNKRGIFLFNRNKNTNIYNIGKSLINKNYIPNKYRLFMIFEPKPRLVMSQDVSDKIVNHFIANYYLIPYLEKKLIDSNVATRKNKGTKYALYLFEKYIHEIRMKYKGKEIYILKLDISKYFYNINHDILINKLENDIKDKDVINLLKLIINETNKDYINKSINELNNYYKTEIPLYKNGVGLSIGAMTSQFLAIYYLNDIDHFIKENLNCKWYIRYMDDFIIMDINKNRLINVWNAVEHKLNELKLKVNPKSNIYKLSNGIVFLGYKYIINHNKLEVLYNKKTKKKIDIKLNNLEKNNKIKYYRTYASYYGYFIKIKKMERNFNMKTKELYDNYKKDYNKKIVFIRDSKFYYTYESDAIIMWNLFDYKWHNNCIAFGDSASRKVFNLLKNKSIGYIVISNENLVVNGDDRVYDLELELSKIGYDKYVKKKEIIRVIDNLLIEDYNNYDIILSRIKGD